MKRPWLSRLSWLGISVSLSLVAGVLEPIATHEAAAGTFFLDGTERAVGGKPSGSFLLGNRESGEIVGLRTRTSRTMASGQGNYVTEIYPASIHYRDGSGAWQPIDNTLVPSSLPGQAYQNRAHRYAVHLPADIAGPVRVFLGEDWLSFRIDGARGPAAVSGATATFADALPGVTVAYTATSDAVKEEIVLHGPGAPPELSFQLETSPGLRAAVNERGGLDFVRASGEVAFSVAPPFMYDASGEDAGISDAVTLSLRDASSGQILTVTPDAAWLASPARRWPVVIDPTITFAPVTDCTLKEGNEAGLCGEVNLKVGLDTTKRVRSVLKFDVQSAIPVDAQVLNAELGLYLFDQTTGAVTPIGVYGVTRAWTSGATWKKYDGVNLWTTPGGDFDPTPAYVNTAVGGTLGWYRWYPTDLVQGWVNGTVPNHGLILKEPDETIDNQLKFHSAESADPALRPYLKVTYHPWAGEQRFYTLETQELTDRMHLHVNVASGNLVVHETDLRIEGRGLDFVFDRYYNNLSPAAGAFGNGWVMGTGRDVGLVVFGDGSAAFYAPSGFQIPFEKRSDGTFESPTGIDATLSKKADGTYTLSFHETGERYEFTAGGYLASHVDQNGNAITFAYTADGRLTSVTDTQGRVASFAYDASGHVTTMTDPAGRTYLYGYKPNGELEKYTDPAGSKTKFSYDKGNLVQIVSPGGGTTTLTYDAPGRVTSITRVTDPLGGTGPTTTFTYGQASTTVTDPRGDATTYATDHLGRAVEVIDPASAQTDLAYTPNSDLAQQIDPLGAITALAYDGLNNLTTLTSPTNATTSRAYADPAHPYYPTSITDAKGKTTSYAYDAAGNLIQVTDPLGHVTRYAYNANGTPSSVTDANGNVTSFSYDPVGNLTEIDYPTPLGSVRYTYDGLGRVTSETDGRGLTTTFSYDVLDRVTKVTYADGTSASFAYDADGNRTSLTDASGTTSYAYDALDRQVSKTLPDGQVISYTWDGAGNLQLKKDNGGKVAFSYDARGLLTSLTDPKGAVVGFAYDAAGQRTRIDYPNGVSLSFAFDGSGQTTSVTAKNSAGAVLLSRSYSYVDPATQKPTELVFQVTEQDGKTTSYGYDGLNKLTSATTRNASGAVVDERSYTYDPVGNMTAGVENGATTTYSYNAANQLISGGGLTYTYDGAGNLTARSDGLALTYDARGFTSTMTPPAGSPIPMTYSGLDQTERVRAGGTSFAYDLLGFSQRTEGTATVYEIRDEAGQLLAERTSKGTYYVLFDRLGSTLGLTDVQGALVATWQYDPWGRILSRTGTIDTPFLFTGAHLDQSTGLYKMGARYYDPAVGRWTQLDPVSGCALQPNEGNRYLYVGADPVNRTDSSGLFSLACFVACMTGVGVLARACRDACRWCRWWVSSWNPFCWGCVACLGAAGGWAIFCFLRCR